jgi:predicted AAA+ superfamily ATPase
MFKRIVNLSKTQSFFLFGARGTGKTTLLNHVFTKNTLKIDLLDANFEEKLEQEPRTLLTLIDAQKNLEWVLIDEIQKVPKLLDVVHQLSSNKKIKFVLTGSSARKLKRGNANLLAGRAIKLICHPLTSIELAKYFDLNQVLQFGSLPEIFSLNESEKKYYLRAYVDNYFKEEIVAEQIVRTLKPFKNFLSVAAQMNGKILNINKISKDVGVDHATIQNYFEILEDTLVGFILEPFHQSIRKRQRQASKFYFFDTGVTRALTKQLEVTLTPETVDYGNAFEHFLILEMKRLADYYKPDWTFSYLRTKDDAEIDLIIERPGEKTLLIEIKSTSKIQFLEASTFTTLSRLAADIKNSKAYLFSQDPIEQKIKGIHCIPWQKGLNEIGF